MHDRELYRQILGIAAQWFVERLELSLLRLVHVCVAVFSPRLTRLCYATYRGGADRDLLGIDMYNTGITLATGLTLSRDLLVSARHTRDAVRW
jgi:hypothetical protein